MASRTMDMYQLGELRPIGYPNFVLGVTFTILDLYFKRFLDNYCLVLIGVDNYLAYKG